MYRILATKSDSVGLIVRAISFQDFQPRSQFVGAYALDWPSFQLSTLSTLNTHKMVARLARYALQLQKTSALGTPDVSQQAALFHWPLADDVDLYLGPIALTDRVFAGFRGCPRVFA